MFSIKYIILGLIGIGIFIGIVWRYFSRRVSIPCPSWLSWMVELDNPFTKTNRAHVIIGHLDLKPGMSVLDAGCGPGRLTIPIAKKIGPQGTVVAMDIQSEMLNKIREKTKTENLHNIQFLQAGIGKGILSANQFDRAVLITVLGEIPDQESAFKELFNALKPGGLLAVTEVIFDPHFQRRGTVRRLAKAVGFQEKATIGNCISFTMLLEKPYDA